jgi:hypothetical protein
MLTPETISAIVAAATAAGNSVRISPDGTLEIIPPAEKPKSAAAERMKRYRERNRASRPVTKRNDVTESVTANRDVTPKVSASPSLPPSPPTPSPSALTPTGGKRERMREDTADFDAACAVALDMTANPQLRQAWHEWQTYRQARHKRTGTERLRWTLQAANLSASQVIRAAEAHGTQIVIDRITAAIAGNWQGLNFDKLQTTAPNGNRNTGRNSGPPPPSGFKSFRTDGAEAPANLTTDSFYR